VHFGTYYPSKKEAIMTEKKTPLYDVHLASGAKVIEFGGWLMPVQYSGILEEHRAVRTAAGLFDVSHMGEVAVSGPEADAFINCLVTNDISPLHINQAMYSPMCYPDGTVVDDLLIYRLGEQEYLLVINAGNIEKDLAWIQQQADGFQLELKNLSAVMAQLALQGPKAAHILQTLVSSDLQTLKYYWFWQGMNIHGISCLISRTGYTGEDGFELYCPAEAAPALWQILLQAGAEYGLIPVGLGARDTLRFESALPLYGHELSDQITPLEAGLDMFVKLTKAGFTGSEALAAQKQTGITRKIVGLEMTGRGIARAGYTCVAGGKTIGTVTSGSFAPTIGKNLALALLDIDYIQPGIAIGVEIRGGVVDAVVVKKPFYRRPSQTEAAK
jgi:aminomethyltransferase